MPTDLPAPEWLDIALGYVMSEPDMVNKVTGRGDNKQSLYQNFEGEKR